MFDEKTALEADQLVMLDTPVALADPPETYLTVQTVQDQEEPLILDELLIEEVNIDGMCGVY